MDSANNSGSMQSSDEEYESRGESFTSFLNPSGAGGHFGSISDHHHHHHHQPPPSPPLLPQQYHQNSLFNPNSQSLEAAFAQSSNVNTEYGGNHDVVWSRGLRSQNNHHPNFENFVALSSSSSSSSFSSSSNQSLFGASHSQLLLNQQQQQPQPQFTSSSSSTMPPSQSAEGNPPTAGSDHQSIGKNPKKRTRASRRAPTTVLTTDTTNFRQMVQEFTGIPAAPFSSSPYSRRLDLFSGGGGGGGGVSGMRSGNLDALNPLYPLRPSAQKHQISPFLPQSSSSSSSPSPSSLLSSTMLEALVSATNQSTTNNASSTTPENLLSMHNQMLSFQKQPTSLKNSTSILGTKSLTANANVTSSNKLRSTTQQGVPVTSFDDFGLNHENNVNENVGNINQQLGSNISGNYQFNCSASTSEFHSDKGLENVSSSGEGTVGQWVCPDH